FWSAFVFLLFAIVRWTDMGTEFSWPRLVAAIVAGAVAAALLSLGLLFVNRQASVPGGGSLLDADERAPPVAVATPPPAPAPQGDAARGKQPAVMSFGNVDGLRIEGATTIGPGGGIEASHSTDVEIKDYRGIQTEHPVPKPPDEAPK